ncbi:MAG TPA: hypothetical protein VEK57_28565 [Thermoanaerobaculia bacterium]|nr:hypothetical protein [Thermoanaerobaculia bacterium]
MSKRALLCFVAAAVALDLSAQCNFNFKKVNLGDGDRWRLEWTRAAGTADPYLLQEIRTVNGNTISEYFQVTANSQSAGRWDVSLTSTDTTTRRYILQSQGGQPCGEELEVTFAADPDFTRLMRKSIVPLVGSTPGNNGALFKTELRLRGETGMSGRLVLHPLGRPGSDADPQMRYEFRATDNGVLEYEDVVAQLGVTGLGSLDIIPDPSPAGLYIVPTADVRLYNVADGGTFGTIETQTQAWDFFGARQGSIKALIVTVPGPELRLNIGFRTLEGTGVLIFAYRGGQLIASANPTLEGDYLFFASAESILGVTLMKGDTIRIMDPDGGSIPMYSLTDNVTNDPALFVPPTRVLTDVTHFEQE